MQHSRHGSPLIQICVTDKNNSQNHATSTSPISQATLFLTNGIWKKYDFFPEYFCNEKMMIGKNE